MTSLLRLRRPIRSRACRRFRYPVGTEAEIVRALPPDQEAGDFVAGFRMPADLVPAAVAEDWREELMLTSADCVRCPVSLDVLSVDEWQILLWDVFELGELPPKGERGKRLRQAMKSLSDRGLLVSDDAARISFDGQMTVSHLFDIARSLTGPQARDLEVFANSFSSSWQGIGSSVVLRSLSHRRLAYPAKSRPGGLLEYVTPIGYACDRAREFLKSGLLLPWEGP